MCINNVDLCSNMWKKLVLLHEFITQAINFLQTPSIDFSLYMNNDSNVYCGFNI